MPYSRGICIVNRIGYVNCVGKVCLVHDYLSGAYTLMCERHVEWSNRERKRYGFSEFYKIIQTYADNIEDANRQTR